MSAGQLVSISAYFMLVGGHRLSLRLPSGWMAAMSAPVIVPDLSGLNHADWFTRLAMFMHT
jgi:hypothetical protein